MDSKKGNKDEENVTYGTGKDLNLNICIFFLYGIFQLTNIAVVCLHACTKYQHIVYIWESYRK